MKKIYVSVLLVISVLLCNCGLRAENDTRDTEYVEGQRTETESEGNVVSQMSETESSEAAVGQNTEQESAEDSVIYTFLQGLKSYEKGKLWSGAWCNHEEGGQAFGHFGCSFCCMANIYDTLSPYVCSPLDFLTFTKEVTSYDPSSGSTALGWIEMKQAMALSGLSCELWNKDDSYDAFAEKLKKNRTAIVLVCSGNDDTIWQNEGGHYVNIWDYEEETGTVFLADPASPTKNRTQVSLKLVYDALKTSSAYQYLLVTAYEVTADSWKKDGIDENWYSGL